MKVIVPGASGSGVSYGVKAIGFLVREERAREGGRGWEVRRKGREGMGNAKERERRDGRCEGKGEKGWKMRKKGREEQVDREKEVKEERREVRE